MVPEIQLKTTSPAVATLLDSVTYSKDRKSFAIYHSKSEAVPLHAMEALGGEEV
jgi:hypothetical protein